MLLEKPDYTHGGYYFGSPLIDGVLVEGKVFLYVRQPVFPSLLWLFLHFP